MLGFNITGEECVVLVRAGGEYLPATCLPLDPALAAYVSTMNLELVHLQVCADPNPNPNPNPNLNISLILNLTLPCVSLKAPLYADLHFNPKVDALRGVLALNMHQTHPLGFKLDMHLEHASDAQC